MGNSYDFARPLALDSSEKVYLTGESTGIGTSSDYVTIKYNTSGDSLWVTRYNGPVVNNDKTSFLAIDGSGNVYITGQSTGSGTGYDYATINTLN